MDNLERKRHSLAHLLAAAVLELYPDAKNTIGPATETGFYYDFEFSGVISDRDLPKIQKQMKKLLATWDGFECKEVSAEEAREIFKDNKYKIELINEIIEKGEPITLYTSGKFTDLCRGGHVESMREIKPDDFALERVAGAYWRGDENNIMLTRIYGSAFNSKEELETYQKRLAEASERDHRKIGKELDLFVFSELVGAGLPLFTPKGTAMRNAIVDKIMTIQKRFGYEQVSIPHITKTDLYKKSGHWEKFGDELFHVKGRETEFVMKPMNCPHHTQIYASKGRSYRDLPIRYGETTMVYRDEQSGELLGLGRVRSITQDDGHVFCTDEQITGEIKNIVEIVKEFYSSLDMWKEGIVNVRLSSRDPETPDKFLGSEEIWNHAEEVLESIAKNLGFPYTKDLGGAAFYGPKIDFIFKDALGRDRQLATIQLDFVQPSRFGLEYTSSDGTKKTPVMIHRAIAGSLERFMSIMIEHFAGKFPLWLSPVQIKILPVAEPHAKHAYEITQTLREKGFRIELTSADEGFGKRVRNAKQEKVPYFIIIGDKDIEENKVTLESRDNGQLGQFSVDEVLDKLN